MLLERLILLPNPTKVWNSFAYALQVCLYTFELLFRIDVCPLINVETAIEWYLMRTDSRCSTRPTTISTLEKEKTKNFLTIIFVWPSANSSPTFIHSFFLFLFSHLMIGLKVSRCFLCKERSGDISSTPERSRSLLVVSYLSGWRTTKIGLLLSRLFGRLIRHRQRWWGYDGGTTRSWTGWSGVTCPPPFAVGLFIYFFFPVFFFFLSFSSAYFIKTLVTLSFDDISTLLLLLLDGKYRLIVLFILDGS